MFGRDAQCRTSITPPSFEKPWYGCVMPYHIHAAVPPAISTISNNNVSKYFKSASPIHFLFLLKPALPPALAVPDTPSKSRMPPPLLPCFFPAFSLLSSC